VTRQTATSITAATNNVGRALGLVEAVEEEAGLYGLFSNCAFLSVLVNWQAIYRLLLRTMNCSAVLSWIRFLAEQSMCYCFAGSFFGHVSIDMAEDRRDLL
jgi:hypothetical protein